MEAIILPDDELKRVERTLGANVRQMGSWNSDGVYGYLTIPIIAIQKAADVLHTPSLTDGVEHLKQRPESAQTKLFCELLYQYGSILVETIVRAYRESLPLFEWQYRQRAVSVTG